MKLKLETKQSSSLSSSFRVASFSAGSGISTSFELLLLETSEVVKADTDPDIESLLAVTVAVVAAVAAAVVTVVVIVVAVVVVVVPGAFFDVKLL